MYKDNETLEFVVKLVGAPLADYFTTDKDDALGTAELMLNPKEVEVIQAGTTKVEAVNTTVNKEVQAVFGTVRIGTGTVRHPAKKIDGQIKMLCGCHSNNLMRSRVMFFAGGEPNCKR